MKPVKPLSLIIIFFFLSVFTGCSRKTDYYSRGIGVYPGNPAEYCGPSLIADTSVYRNIALHRPAYHSSSYDYNLTAQLVTDGIITNDIPSTISVSTNKQVLKKNEREWLFDGKSDSRYRITATDFWIKLGLSGQAPELTSMKLTGSVTYDSTRTRGWQFICWGSSDGTIWDKLGTLRGSGLPGSERQNPFAGMRPPQQTAAAPANARPATQLPAPFAFRMRKERLLNETFRFSKPVSYRFYQISVTMPAAQEWSLGEWNFLNGEDKLLMTPSKDFKSAWMSAGNPEEWIYIDLGSKSSFDLIKLYWITAPPARTLQVSDDAKTWTDLLLLSDNDQKNEIIKLSGPARGRYLRILMKGAAAGTSYILSEAEIFGKGGLLPVPKISPAARGNKLFLSGGKWKIARYSEVLQSGGLVSSAGFNDSSWVTATVPATALVSYLNAGAVADPDFSDNQLMISESFFNSDFWYRNEFDVPENFSNRKLFLNFDGINWKATVFVNGVKTGRIEGAFMRGKFDVTGIIIPGKRNSIAVLVEKNANPGSVKEKTAQSTDQNGGILGADNPTFHASVGWDWIPTIRGRETGIWNDVWLSATGDVTISDQHITTCLPLPDTTFADISIELALNNHSSQLVNGTLEGQFGPVRFEKALSLGPGETRIVKLDPSTNPELHFLNPRLWWPHGYGAPNLYDVRLSFKNEKGISDEVSFKSGVREMTFTEDKQILNLYINGRRFIGRGGNWGFPESNLRYREREYDIAVAYHAGMNFNMIRNWVGQTGDDEFFEACDRHGIMVWQDFWLANPADGPDPSDPDLFMRNATDFVKKIRNHPSIAIYVGRNEGNPPLVLDTALRTMVRRLHPDIHYISNSASGVVSGGGPYRALQPAEYFRQRGNTKFHSERGMPNMVNYESLKRMLPETGLWPHNNLWGMHDFTLGSAQSVSTFIAMVNNAFGKTDDAVRFAGLAQWINYNGYRAMFEGRSDYRQGLLLWMSHPAWPSMVWQTYDYYFEPTAAYFGCKKASEPVHIQWNPLTNDVEVVNYNGKNRENLLARAEVLNMNGSVIWKTDKAIDCREDSTARCFRLEFPKDLSPVHYIKLTLTSGRHFVSENFYIRSLEDGNLQDLNNLAQAKIKTSTSLSRKGDEWLIKTSLKNKSGIPALMIRLKVAGKESGESILPVFYSDNYISLMPDEHKTVIMKFSDRDTRGERPAVIISGFNIKE